MVEIQRVYANIKELAGDYHLSVRENLSYVKTLSNYGVNNVNRNSEKIILLCEKVSFSMTGLRFIGII